MTPTSDKPPREDVTGNAETAGLRPSTSGVDIHELFRGEASRRLGNIVDTLNGVGGDSSLTALETLFREAHTINGDASMLGLTDVVRLAQAVEDVLATTLARGVFPPELQRPLLRAANALRRQVEENEDPPSDLLDELAGCRARLTLPC